MPVMPQNLLNLNAEQMKKLLNAFETILVDCDGVLWYDDQPIPQTSETINALLDQSKNIYFVTNNSTKTRHELWLKAQAMNFHVNESNIISPTYSVASYLKTHLIDGKAYVIGSEALAKELTAMNVEFFGPGPDFNECTLLETIESVDKQSNEENIQAVIVGFDEHFSYKKILKACNFMRNNKNCMFLATNNNTVAKYPDYNIPDTGALVAAVEACVERKALIMGKPNRSVADQLINEGLINPANTLMIGDCAKIDVVFGKNCGFSTLLVGTGRYQWKHVQKFFELKHFQYIPDFYIPSLGDFKQCL
uniref:4-nitrophenylphosphatase n=1 Tax=Glossina brevipalpis TaxID=37001 RepID=A0A1A9WE46_9MUSC